MKNNEMKKHKLNITVFLCGAIGMILELIAARVLSPYVGSSNLIWTSIIGVMLISMSLGYWIGGKFADKKSDIQELASFVLIAAIFTSLIPIFESVLIKWISNVSDNYLLVALSMSAIVFGIPSFMLATVSPYAVKLKTIEEEKVGSVSGKNSSISTIGSIVGTFIGGFLLIPSFGIRTIIFVIAIVLVAIAVMLMDKRKMKYMIRIAISIVIIVAAFFIGDVLFKAYNPEVLKDVNSEYSRMLIKEVVANDDTTYKTLEVDKGLESYINKDTNEMGARYLYYYNLFEYYNKNANNTLMIGGAAYTYPSHYLKAFQNRKIDVVEIDEKMTQLAVEEFDLDIQNENLTVYHQDGRGFLNKTQNKYDTILLDAFKGLNAPFELTTYEAISKAYQALNENGMLITNTISAIEGEESDFLAYEYATYKAVFDEVKVFQVRDLEKDEQQNIILVGIKGKPEIDETKTEQYKVLLEQEITDFTSDKRIVTDNFAPIGN